MQDSPHPEDMEAYLKAYPQGRYAPAARLKLRQLQRLHPPMYKLTVRTIPEDSRIKILNIGPPYYPGIELEPGQYDSTPLRLAAIETSQAMSYKRIEDHAPNQAAKGHAEARAKLLEAK